MSTAGTGPAVRVDGLTKRYRDGTEALRGVSFEVDPGVVFSLLGRNGSGKTTTVRILTGLTAPTGGHVEVLGHDVVTDTDVVQARIGVTLQESSLDEVLTGREFLTFVGSLVGTKRSRSRDRADELLGLFGLADDADRPIGTYSGGMQRRIDLAAALVRRPEVLFLDEPTTGLDPQNRRALWREIEGLRDSGTTIFLTTQYLEEAEVLADEIAIYDHGRLIDVASPASLRSSYGSTRLTVKVRAEQREQALSGLRDTASVTGANGSIQAEVNGPDEALTALSTLRDQGVEIDDFEIRRDSLEDVFLRLTGTDAERVGEPMLVER